MVEFDLKDVKALMDLMRKNSVSELELEKEGFKIRIRRGQNGGAGSVGSEEAGPIVQMPPPVVVQAAPAVAPVLTTLPVEAEIKSPMIGTFYRAPSPESAPYVEVGTEVNPETVVCIIEAMKVMNEIKSEVSGTIVERTVKNGQAVEYGQVLFRVRPD